MPLYSKNKLNKLLTNIRNNSLKVLDISSSHWNIINYFILSSTELSQISQAFKQNSSIQQVAMLYNQIATEGAGYIADMLGNHKTVKALYLRSNSIDAPGAKLISEGLAKNDSLHLLKLDYNLIGDDGVIALSQALSANQTLKIIGLTGNGITDKGAQALIEMLNSNYTLIDIDLTPGITFADLPYTSNDIDSQHRRSIQQSLQRNRALQEFLKQEVANAASYLLKGARNLLRPNQLNTSKLPEDIKQYILSFLDSQQVLKPAQVKNIIQYAQSKSTLSKLPGLFGFGKYRKKSDFLKETQCDHYYHSPITPSHLSLFFGASHSKEQREDEEVFEKSSEVSLIKR